MPCSTMLENAALLVSAAVELYFIKIYGGGGGGGVFLWCFKVRSGEEGGAGLFLCFFI